MRNTNSILILLFISLATFRLQAQQVFIQPASNLNRLGYNPAVTGSNERTSFFVSNRSDQNIKYSVAQAETSIQKSKLATGLMFESYQSLLETQSSIRLNLAYRLKTQNGFWQMGLAPIIHSYRINTNNLTIRNDADALSPQNNVNRWALNFNAGILYKTPKLFVSASVQNISKTANPLDSDYGYLIEYQQYSLFSSYAFRFGQDWQYVPGVYLLSVNGQGNYAALCNQLQHKYFFAGFQYGVPQSWVANIGFNHQPENKGYNLRIGYAMAERNNGLFHSYIHEVFLSIGFGTTDVKQKVNSLKDFPQYRSPIYF